MFSWRAEKNMTEEEEMMASKKALLKINDDLLCFRTCVTWLCLDQSTRVMAIFSWTIFGVLTVFVPAVSHYLLDCPDCDRKHQRPFNATVQLSLSSITILSYLCLTRLIRKYGLRKLVHLDKLCDESEKVRNGYTTQLNKSLKLLSIFVLPCFVGESTYKIWWYASGASSIPFLGNACVSDVVACFMELWSWLYRTSVIFLICVVFRVICHLQILRLQDFSLAFQEESNVATVLAEHLRIRRQLRIISHRFRLFIVLLLLLVTASQFASLTMTTKSHADVDIFKAGELALCSVGLVAGLFVCFRSATKITHKAQAITSQAAKWHACATIDSFDSTDSETPMHIKTNDFQTVNISLDDDEEEEEETVDEDDMDDTKFIPPHAHTISFQKRQALVTYLENNRAGITLFGFMLDRTYLYMIVGVELPVVLFLLGKTVGIS